MNGPKSGGIGRLRISNEALSHRLVEVCVLIDSDVSAASAIRVLPHMAKTTGIRLTLLHLDERGLPATECHGTYAALNSELFVIAMSHGGELTGSTKAWIERWACLRAKDNDCAVVAFVTSGGALLDSHSPLVEYLGSIAAAGGLAFFYGTSKDLVDADSPQLGDEDSGVNHLMTGDCDHLSPRWGINE